MVPRGILRRWLLAGVAASLLLPIVVAVVTGLGVLLRAVGDDLGATVCGWVALIAGACWLVAIIATAVASGVALLEDRPPPVETEQQAHR